jgi:hypothetical protein
MNKIKMTGEMSIPSIAGILDRINLRGGSVMLYMILMMDLTVGLNGLGFTQDRIARAIMTYV